MPLPADFDELVETLAFLDDWEERYGFIIELGRQLEPLPEAAYCEANKVRGCMSQVWLIHERCTGPDGEVVLHLAADSDAHIVKGLVAVLMVLFSDRTPAQILSVDVEDAFRRLQLEEHLSPNRRNGFFAMIERIRALARAEQTAA